MGTATEVQHPSEIFSGIAATLYLLLQSFVTFLVEVQVSGKPTTPFRLVAIRSKASIIIYLNCFVNACKLLQARN
jgi:hypothetical protein